ncbi:hypothetical protein PHYPSEUDO_010039 [Phytophthora pseudosyringae]|uniref:EF-hand domain-containing protein n=1 Tax=Phytophthora pseudosyringae TaxID=221518 RepID=A0A8T1W6Q0_9STRA|nr:hypothetical protein PHYPSEUDO_010039 [Phytophthora pseudosyringae]
MESLDAGHALLSDVATRNRELQARLRSSLPLLWTSSALVTTSAAGPRRRRGGGGLPAEQSAAGEADQMLLALEGQSGLQVSRRYKRRMEWEVARRIARVDRELQQYPPAQRFWNHKRKEPTPSHASAAYRQRASGVRRADVQRKSDGVGGQRKPAVKAAAGRAKSGVPHTSAVNQQEKKGWTKPKVATEMDGGVGRMIKHLSASPVRGGVEDTEDKENTKPNAATRAQAGAQFAVGNSKESPLWGDLTAVKKVLGKPHDGLSVSEDEIKESKPGDSAHDLEATSNTVLRQPAEAKSESLRPAPSPLTDDIFTNEKDTVANARQDGVGDDTFVIAESSPRRTKTPAEERASSSIGRQVLSDYRTMPSVASFGAQPILSGAMGNPADMRWNADVLRRLFSDLDTDKDGHVNRIETCMALHRLRISVPTTKIISFFRHIHSSDAKGARSRHTQHLPMKEVINYKEFVAFVTAAYDQQQQRRAQRSRAPTRRKVRKEEHDTVAHLSAPSTSLPIYAHPTRSPRASRYVHPREDDARVYEVNLEQGEAAIEDRVMKEIPDFLVSRILAGTASAASVESRENVVRKSLELLVGKEAVDDKIVSEITQELIREQLRNIGSLNQDDTEDVTGLKRAAAYYNEQMTQCDSESCSVAEDSSSEDLINWADVLTEEQVSGLVQQIWKDRQAAGLRRMSVVPVEDVLVEERTEMPEDPTVRWTNEATDMKELSVPAILTDKAVQAFDGDYQAEPSSTSADLIVAAPERKYVKHKSKALNVVESVNDDDNRHSSVESGELPALMKAHANFRSQLVDQSTTSSVESGELEDGSVPD